VVGIAIFEELGGGAVERDHHLLRRPLAGLLNRLHHEVEQAASGSTTMAPRWS
jgi:hypothetical protein